MPGVFAKSLNLQAFSVPLIRHYRATLVIYPLHYQRFVPRVLLVHRIIGMVFSYPLNISEKGNDELALHLFLKAYVPLKNYPGQFQNHGLLYDWAVVLNQM